MHKVVLATRITYQRCIIIMLCLRRGRRDHDVRRRSGGREAHGHVAEVGVTLDGAELLVDETLKLLSLQRAQQYLAF